MSNEVSVGWATVSITPEGPVQIQGQHYERVSESVHDEIVATALAIEGGDGTNRADCGVVFLSCDLTMAEPIFIEPLRRAIAESGRAPDFDPANLIVAATHTHTAPVLADHDYPPPAAGVTTPAEYRRFLVSRLTDAVATAWNSRSKATVAPALSYAAVGFNRRTAFLDGRSVMYGNSDDRDFAGMEGGEDHGVELLYTFTPGGDLTGVVVNLSCPSQVMESKCTISGDFWTSARRRVREAFGESVHLLPLCGAAGDQSPRDLVRRGRRDADFRDESGMEELGRRIFAAVVEAYPRAEPARTAEVLFAHRCSTLDLPARKITDEEAETLRGDIARYEAAAPAPSSTDGGRLRKARRALARYESQGPAPVRSTEVHAVRLGDIVFATNPFELFLDYGLRMKARSKAVQTFVVQLACDRGLYLPTRRALASGHYGTIPSESFVGPDGGEVLVERTLEMIAELLDR